MDNGRKINYRLFTWILVILFCILGFFYIQQYFKVRELEKYKQNNIENIKEIKRQLIESNKSDIDSLKQLIVNKDEIINKAKLREDSLLNADARVVYVFNERKKEIKEFDAEKLENYWKDEFK